MDFTRLIKLASQLKKMRPLNDTELKRLREEFIIENTYNTNTIEGNTLTLRETALVIDGITIGENRLKTILKRSIIKRRLSI